MRTSSDGPATEIKRNKLLLANLTFGHGVAHFYQQSFPVLLPNIVNDLGIGGLGVGALGTVRHFTALSVEMPGGFIVDMVKHRWGLILAGCIGLISAAWLVAGITTNFKAFLIAMVLIALPGTIWHLPAMAALSQRMPQRRGLAISIHGMGGNLGNILGPLVAGILLGVFFLTWRQVAFLYALPPVVVASIFWVSLQSVGRHGPVASRGLKVRLKGAWQLAKNPNVRALVVVSMLRGMGFDAITLFLPIYLTNELKMGAVMVGFHVALLSALGTVAIPALGLASDKFGRKAVLLPGLVLMSMLIFTLVNVGAGLTLTLVIGAMGIFYYSLSQVLRAAVLDLAPQGAEATSYGLVFGSTQLVAAFSPLFAGTLLDWLGIRFVFYYAGVVMAFAALALVIGFLPRRSDERPLSKWAI